jgi:hypothetical protein
MIKLFQVLKAKLLRRTNRSIFVQDSAKIKPNHSYVFPWNYDK